MKLTLQLQPTVWHKGPLSFNWDSDAGTVSGTDAETVQTMAKQAVAAGSVAIHPHPARYPIADPLTKPDEMAALLGNFWKLPEELAVHYPQVDQVPETIQALDEAGNHIREIPVRQ